MVFLISAVLSISTVGVTNHERFQIHCGVPHSITHVVRGNGETYQSTYKLFDGQWEEVDTESSNDSIPEALQRSNTQMQERFDKKCNLKAAHPN